VDIAAAVAVEIVHAGKVAVGIQGLRAHAGRAARSGALGLAAEVGHAQAVGGADGAGAAVWQGHDEALRRGPVVVAPPAQGVAVPGVKGVPLRRHGVGGAVVVGPARPLGVDGTALRVVAVGGQAAGVFVDAAGHGPGQVGTLVQVLHGFAVGPGELAQVARGRVGHAGDAAIGLGDLADARRACGGLLVGELHAAPVLVLDGGEQVGAGVAQAQALAVGVALDTLAILGAAAQGAAPKVTVDRAVRLPSHTGRTRREQAAQISTQLPLGVGAARKPHRSRALRFEGLAHDELCGRARAVARRG
jgi:hypothetical protein